MYAIHRHKIILLIVITITCSYQLYAQANMEQYDNKRLHFGFTLGTNIGRMRIDRNTARTPIDTVKNINQITYPGIGLGAITNLHLNQNWDLRLLFPVISFVQRNIEYEFDNSKKIAEIESAYCDASLLVKFKSDRRKNTRVYVIGGFRGSYDLASTTKQDRSIAKPVVSLKPLSFGYEAGIGLDMYFEYFKFSPEIKFCSTYGNTLFKDGYVYTEAIYRLTPQLIQISLHFEG
ncbi:MAG: PorT family protein [Bacteroidia bacterium]|nr:PorT family protein [Bacteroidia bacterium]